MRRCPVPPHLLLGGLLAGLLALPLPAPQGEVVVQVGKEWVSPRAGGEHARFPVSVRDPSANTDPLRAETVTAVVRNITMGLEVPVALTETGPDTGVFTGEVEVRAQTEGLGPGQVPGFHGHRLVVLYRGVEGEPVVKVDTARPLVQVLSHREVDFTRPGGVVLRVQVEDTDSGFPEDPVTLRRNAGEGKPGRVVFVVGGRVVPPDRVQLERVPGGWEARVEVSLGREGATERLLWWAEAVDRAGNAGGPDLSLTSTTTQVGARDLLVDARWKGMPPGSFVGRAVRVLTGPAQGQVREVEAFTPETGALRVREPFRGPIAQGTRYEVMGTLLLVVDGRPPRMVSAVTGEWWDPARPPPQQVRGGAHARRDSIRVVFEDESGLLTASVRPETFLVDGERPLSVQVVERPGGATSLTDVFLTLPRGLPTGSTPRVVLAGRVRDRAGNFARVGEAVRARDGIPPTLSLEVERPVDPEEVALLLRSSEPLRPQPLVKALPVLDDQGTLAGESSPFTLVRLGPTIFRMTISSSVLSPGEAGRRFSVWARGVDSVGNPGEVGDPHNALSPEAVTVELDRRLNNGRPPRVLVGGQQVPIRGSGERVEVPLADPLVITVDFSAGCEVQGERTVCTFPGEGAEYPGDTHATVEITLARVEVELPDGTRESLDASVSTGDGVRFLVSVPRPRVGRYLLRLRARDEAGNTRLSGPPSAVPDDLLYTFAVGAPAPVEVPLAPGWNLVSLPFPVDNPAVNHLIPKDHPIRAVMTWDAREGQWLVSRRNPETGLLEGDIKELRADTAYFVSTTSFEPLRLVPPPPLTPFTPPRPPPAIRVVAGWNLIPVVSLRTPLPRGIPADEYLSSLGGKWLRALTLDPLTGQWLSISRTPEPRVRVVREGETFVDMCGEEHRGPVEVKVDRLCLGRGYWLWASEPGVIIP